MNKLVFADHEVYFIGTELIIKSPVSMVRLDEAGALDLFDFIGEKLVDLEED